MYVFEASQDSALSYNKKMDEMHLFFLFFLLNYYYSRFS